MTTENKDTSITRRRFIGVAAAGLGALSLAGALGTVWRDQEIETGNINQQVDEQLVAMFRKTQAVCPFCGQHP